MTISFQLRCCVLLASVMHLPAPRTLWADVRPGDIAVVFAETTDFGMRDQPMARLDLGASLRVTEVRGSWVGGAADVAGQRQLGWVHRRSVQRVAGRSGEAATASALATTIGQLLRAQVHVQLDGNGYVHALDASGGKIVDSDLASCDQFDHLVAVDVSGTSVGDAGVALLAKSGSLERIYAENTPVTGKSLEQLTKLKQLEVLVLAGTKIRGDDLARLAAIPTLRTVNLAHCDIRDEDLRHLEALTHLEVLVLSDTAIAGPGLKSLKPLPHLRVLNLSNTRITDAEFVQLAGAPSLRMLYVRGTQITTDASDKLDKSLTSCSIYH